MPLSNNLRGAIYMSIAMAGFTANDTLTKFVSESMNMGQVMLIRGLFATMLIALLASSQGALRNPRQALHPFVLLRSASELLGTVAFLVALSHIPLATTSAVLQALPLAVTVGAALVFGEEVRWRRWLAIALGFAGVLIVVRPGTDAFEAYTLWALASVGFCAVRDLATKRLPQSIPTLLVSTVTAAMVMICGAFLVGPMGGWSPVSGSSLGLLAMAAVLLLVGYQFIIQSMRTAEISYVAPFRYTALLWAIVLGFLVFRDVPDGPMMLGAAIIVGSGLYTLYRERIAGRGRPAAASASPAMAPDGL
ncbi:DMT family transporter [Mesorhizobium sp. BAC0120]|uniref:DMT family transporter n=1 Tax=Mesorhizobium sp. BAC0120 TaxID=3090670 RepID=UPI00298CEF25|nr:DMT family transporter [Mesorhizobium sp. BAC0120]MDW6023697.1 DMT family transporter [Mesorhizobium sp. BAC0120]